MFNRRSLSKFAHSEPAGFMLAMRDRPGRNDRFWPFASFVAPHQFGRYRSIADMPMRHGGILAKRASTWLRDHRCRSTIAPRSSWPTI